MLLACKQREIVKKPLSYGQVEATFNGQLWPTQSSDTFFQVSAQRFRSLCQSNFPQVDSYSYTISIAVGEQNSQEFTDEIGFHFVPRKLPSTQHVQSGTEFLPVEEQCGLFANQVGIAGFNYMLNDGFDNTSYLNYKTNDRYINKLIITRLDTLSKEIEGSFEVSFLKNGTLNKAKPDTIHICCSHFLARLNL